MYDATDKTKILCFSPLPLWLSPSEETDSDITVSRRSSQSSKKSVSKIYIA